MRGESSVTHDGIDGYEVHDEYDEEDDDDDYDVEGNKLLVSLVT